MSMWTLDNGYLVNEARQKLCILQTVQRLYRGLPMGTSRGPWGTSGKLINIVYALPPTKY